MTNTLTATALKRRGMAAIEEGLQGGPLHIVKRNKLVAVVLSEGEYQRLTGGQQAEVVGLTALQWLLTNPPVGTRSKADIDEALAEERSW